MAEAAAYSRRGVLGGAKASTLSGDHNSSTTTLAGADLSTWAGAHTNGPICWTINRGKADEEQGEATAVSGNSLTGVTRGLFGTTAQAHTAGATLELTSSKKDFDEANYTTAETVGKITTAGDLLYSDGANSLTRLGIGTARQQLATNAGATAPEWVASMQSLLTAAGDIIYASAANTPARLAKGTASQVLTMNAGATAPEWAASSGTSVTVVRKTANESVSASTTLQDDDALTTPIAANQVLCFEFFIRVAPGSEAGDIKIDVAAPAGAGGAWGATGLAVATTDPTATSMKNDWSNGFSSSGLTFGLDGSFATLIHVFGTCPNGATPGNLTLRWAQATSDATATQVQLGSFLLAHEAV